MYNKIEAIIEAIQVSSPVFYYFGGGGGWRLEKEAADWKQTIIQNF